MGAMRIRSTPGTPITMIGNLAQGRREGGRGGQNTWGPECSEGPGNLGKMFVLFIIAVCLS